MTEAKVTNLFDRCFVAVARRSWRFYRTAGRDISVLRQGSRIKVPLRHGLGLAHLKPTQSWMERVVSRTYAGRHGLFVDVGANIGQTLLEVQAVAPGEAYLALEPDPEACRYLNWLVRANAWGHIIVLGQALGAEPGVLNLHHSGDADVSASLVEAFRPAEFFSSSIPVKVERGDDLLKRLNAPPIAILKIDVEGGELDVVEGMEERIAVDQPVLIMEVLGYGPIVSGRVFPDISDAERERIVAFRRARTHALENHLRAHDYRFARILETGEERPVDSLDLGSEGEIECNFIATPPNVIAT